MEVTWDPGESGFRHGVGAEARLQAVRLCDFLGNLATHEAGRRLS
jgi:hypothetical protein